MEDPQCFDDQYEDVRAGICPLCSSDETEIIETVHGQQKANGRAEDVDLDICKCHSCNCEWTD